MASLANQTISSSYDGLIKTSSDNAVGVSGVQLLQDGSGNDLAISLGRSGQGASITGNLTVDTNTLFVDAANNRVGIGTQNPDNAALEISYANNQIQINTTNEDTYGRLDIGHFSNGTFIGTQAGSDSSSNLLRFGTSGTERMRIDSSGNVGIGTTPDTNLHIESATGAVVRISSSDTSVDGGSLGKLEFYSNDSSSGGAGVKGEIEAIDDSGFGQNYNLTFKVGRASGGSNLLQEKIRVTQNGLTFNGDTAAANALDDYEEGTFTPFYAPSNGSFATMTMEIITAKYTKIGNMVAVYVGMRTDDIDITGASGDVYIGGLPFVVSGFGGGIAFGLTINFTNSPDGGNFINASTNINLRKAGFSAGLNVSDLSNGTNANHNFVYFSGTYMVS